MYLRSTAQKRKDGSVIPYLQLAQNVWDPIKKRSRAHLLARLSDMIAHSDRLSQTKRAELRGGVISTKPGLHSYLRTTAGGLLRTDAQAVVCLLYTSPSPRD